MDNNYEVWEVWALGYDKDDNCTDVEILMATFQKPTQAISFAECFETKQDIINNYTDQIKEFGELEDGDYFEIKVEKVDISNPEYSQCIDILYEEALK